jgi:hypothetical protein
VPDDRVERRPSSGALSRAEAEPAEASQSLPCALNSPGLDRRGGAPIQQDFRGGAAMSDPELLSPELDGRIALSYATNNLDDSSQVRSFSLPEFSRFSRSAVRPMAKPRRAARAGGCGTVYTLHVIPDLNTGPSGAYTLDVETDRVKATCRFVAPQEGSPLCTDAAFVFGQAGFGAGTSLRISSDEAKPPPALVHVRLYFQGVLLRDQTFRPAYVTEPPTGPNCAACARAEDQLAVR